MPHSSPGSSTTSLSRASVLSDSRTCAELGSGTCLTVTTIFTNALQSALKTTRVRKGSAVGSIIAGTNNGTESQIVVGRVEAAHDVASDVLEPGDVESREHVARPAAT